MWGKTARYELKLYRVSMIYRTVITKYRTNKQDMVWRGVMHAIKYETNE